MNEEQIKSRIRNSKFTMYEFCLFSLVMLADVYIAASNKHHYWALLCTAVGFADAYIANKAQKDIRQLKKQLNELKSRQNTER